MRLDGAAARPSRQVRPSSRRGGGGCRHRHRPLTASYQREQSGDADHW